MLLLSFHIRFLVLSALQGKCRPLYRGYFQKRATPKQSGRINNKYLSKRMTRASVVCLLVLFFLIYKFCPACRNLGGAKASAEDAKEPQQLGRRRGGNPHLSARCGSYDWQQHWHRLLAETLKGFLDVWLKSTCVCWDFLLLFLHNS